MTLHPLTVGFLPLLDCAPLIVAAEKGFARDEGLELRLAREHSWATIRDRVIVGHFHAAHMLGPMPVASTLGIGHPEVGMIAPMALGWGGNSITVSAALWTEMHAHGARVSAGAAQQGAALRAVVRARGQSGATALTFAMVYPFSCHHYVLRYWLAASGIDPDVDVRLVVIPPPFMVDALRAGQVDGFCAGEPWNTLAVTAGIANIVAPVTDIWHRSPDKVLGMRTDWALRRPDDTAALIRALYRACQWCDLAESREELAHLLARADYIGESARVLERGLAAELRFSPADEPVKVAGFQGFSRHFSTFPWASHAQWFYTQMVRWKQIPTAPSEAVFAAGAAAARSAYRPDLYREALRPIGVSLPEMDQKLEGGVGTRESGFFDRRIFDPQDLAGYLTD